MNIIVTGCCGFIGSNITKLFLQQGHNVIGIDNLLLGSKDYLPSNSSLFNFYQLDLSEEKNIDLLNSKIKTDYKIDEIWHLAANSDIKNGNESAKIDLKHTFLSTYNILNFAKIRSIKLFRFASSSAVYGDHGDSILNETSGPLLPISNYGAMKLASEGIISASTEGFLDSAIIYRFPNVVGSPLTHGILFDFINKIKKTPGKLDVLGDGNQKKLYLHVSDLIEAMLCVKHEKNITNVINIGPNDDGITVKHIVKQFLNFVPHKVDVFYEKKNKGWIGDVPKFNYDNHKLKSYGWVSKFSSEEAIIRTLRDYFE